MFQITQNVLNYRRNAAKLLKITVAAVTPDGIVGYGKKSLTYRIRLTRAHDTNPVENAIRQLTRRKEAETDNCNFNFYYLKPQWITVISAVLLMSLVLVLLFVVYCCGKKNSREAVVSNSEPIIVKTTVFCIDSKELYI